MENNRTSWYFTPVLNKYPKSFLAFYHSIKPQLTKIYSEDLMWRKYHEDTRPLFFIEVNPKKLNTIFMSYLKSSRKSSWYVADYVLKPNERHVFCFKVDPVYYQAFKAFAKGLYSQMFTKEQLKDFGLKQVKNGKPDALYAVFHKTPDGIRVLSKSIKTRFGTDVLPENPMEYDLPPNIHDEVLNYNYETRRSSPPRG